MSAILDPTTQQEYLAIVRAFPLVSIRDDAHLADALTVLDRLIDQPTRSAAQEAYLGALTDLVETYEHAHVPIPPTSGVAALRYLMAENGLSPSDLEPLLGPPAVVSAVLAGTRRLSLSHIQRLAAHFGLPADVFIAPARP
jgi:HTH-type transcriptional regulator/antitoxin HigA